MCSSEKGGNCRTGEIVYQLTCETCKEEGRKKIYIGETHRNGKTRSEEHLRDMNSMNVEVVKKSVVNKHSMEDHGGEQVKMSMKKIK